MRKAEGWLPPLPAPYSLLFSGKRGTWHPEGACSGGLRRKACTESIQMRVLFLLAPLCGTGCPRCEYLVGDNCAETAREEVGRISTFPAPWRLSLATVVDSGSGLRRRREPGLPLPRRLCTQPGQTAQAPCYPGHSYFGWGWNLLSLGLMTSVWHENRIRRGNSLQENVLSFPDSRAPYPSQHLT